MFPRMAKNHATPMNARTTTAAFTEGGYFRRDFGMNRGFDVFFERGRNRMLTKKERVMKIPEAEKVSPHTLRHTFATDLYRETKNLRLVQKALGHASVATTQIYTHIVDEELEEALRGFRSGQLAA